MPSCSSSDNPSTETSAAPLVKKSDCSGPAPDTRTSAWHVSGLSEAVNPFIEDVNRCLSVFVDLLQLRHVTKILLYIFTLSAIAWTHMGLAALSLYAEAPNFPDGYFLQIPDLLFLPVNPGSL